MFHDTVWAVDMFDRSLEGSSATVPPSVSLEYGDDQSTCNDKEFEISERGMCFKSRWQFEVGMQLAISFSYCAGGSRQEVEAEAVVADCDPAGSECHQIILLFLELPDNLRAAIRDVSSKLEASIAERPMVIEDPVEYNSAKFLSLLLSQSN